MATVSYPERTAFIRHCARCGSCFAIAIRLFLPAALTGVFSETHAAPVQKGLEFNADIRPILSDSCFVCHGPDKNNRKGELRLDVREVALDKKAIVPGKPDQSEMIRRIYTTNLDDQMPPPDSRRHITAAQKELLKKW